MEQNARSWRRGTNSPDSFRARKGDTPVQIRDLGETNNLHPQRACVSFDEKADGTKAFVTATELVAASLHEESPLRISECRTGANPRSSSRHAYGHFQFRPYSASVDPTEGEMKTERGKERGGMRGGEQSKPVMSQKETQRERT